MHLVISDAGPLNYLILIGHVSLLPHLFERIVLPSAVRSELSHPDAPPEVQAWIKHPPAWLEIIEAPIGANSPGIHKGEAAAIVLASSMRADLLLMDDRKAVRFARQLGLRVTGTLGLLDLAASRGMLDFPRAVADLESTNFRMPRALLAALSKKRE